VRVPVPVPERLPLVLTVPPVPLVQKVPSC
jgi:hypothetical protein